MALNYVINTNIGLVGWGETIAVTGQYELSIENVLSSYI